MRLVEPSVIFPSFPDLWTLSWVCQSLPGGHHYIFPVQGTLEGIYRVACLVYIAPQVLFDLF